MSTDVVKLTLKNLHQTAGKIPMETPNHIITNELDTTVKKGYPQDCWKDVPVKIIVGNRIIWAMVNSIDLGTK